MVMTYSWAKVQGQWSAGSEDRVETVEAIALPAALMRSVINDAGILTSMGLSAVADGPRDAGLCTLKSYQLLHETQLPQCDVACYDERTDAQA